MSFEIERRVAENPPTPAQLKGLAMLGMRSAVARERFKTMSRINKNAHYYIEEVDREDFMLDDGYLPVNIRHRMAVRVGSRPSSEGMPRTQSLKIIDTYFAQDKVGTWRGERSTYRFEWSRARTLMADRTLRLVGFGEDYPGADNPLEYRLDYFRIDNDAIPMLAVTDDLAMVTSDDFEELHSDMRQYIDALPERV